MTDPNASHAAQHVETLQQSLTALITESQSLRSDVHTAEAARKRANQINLGVLGMLVLFVVLLMTVTWQNNTLAKRVSETNTRMADCTTPGGSCYEDGRNRTGDAIGDIIRAEIYVAECARLSPGESGPAFDRKLEACVGDRLSSAAKQRATQPPFPTPAPTKGR